MEQEQEEKEAEDRMNVIGQNGNEGLHYDQEEMIKKNEEILATKKIDKKDIYQEKTTNKRNAQHYG